MPEKNDKPIIIGVGEVECALCKPGSEPKDGLALEIDGAEQHFCWNHLKAMSRMWRNAWEQKPKSDRPEPLFDRLPDPPAEIHVNNRSASLMGN